MKGDMEIIDWKPIDGMTPALSHVSEFVGASDVLWQLLLERDEHVNISHKKMPTREEHDAFVADGGYRAWYIITGSSCEYMGEGLRDRYFTIPIGTVYLTHRCEIGVFILRQHRGKGWGEWAVKMTMLQWGASLKIRKLARHLGAEYYANVNPANTASIKFFEKMGFEVRQLVMARKPPANSWRHSRAKGTKFHKIINSEGLE